MSLKSRITSAEENIAVLENTVSGFDTDDDGRVDKAESVDDGVNSKTALEIKTHLDSLHAPSNAEQNVNADWDAGSGDAQILNKPTVPTALSQLTEDTTHRVVTDTEKSTWNSKEPGNANIQTHVTSAHAPSNAQANADITKAEIEAKLIGVISSHSHTGGGAGAWTTLIKTNDQAVTNSNVLTDCTEITFTTLTNTNYHIRLRILYNTSSIAADFKYRVTHAGTTSRVFRVRTYSIAAGTSATYPTVLPTAAFDTADQTLLTATIGNGIIYEDIYLRVGASGGIFKIAFAQNTATAGQSVTIYEGSYLEYATT